MTALFSSYARAPLAFARGEGAWLYTEDGTPYLDFAAGVAVNSLGHCHPRLVTALTGQAETLWHVSNLYQVPEQERLAERLCAASFAKRVFFCNSGAEAVECAIKTARRWHYVEGRPERYRIITFEGAFHGRTLGTIAAGGQKKYLEGFGPPAPGFDQVRFGDEAALKAAIGPETAAVLVEPIQGEGGIRPFAPRFLRQLREVCDNAGLLLIFDEVQTGIGRSGRLFGYETVGIEPDIMAIAKGIGGGFPLGACLASEAAASGMTPGTHGSTFGGNPLAMAVGNAVLDIVLEAGFLERVRRIGLLLKQRLAAIADSYPQVIETVRGEGLMLGLRCAVPAADLVVALRNRQLLSVGAGDNVVRLMPPLIIGEAEVDAAIARIEAGVAEIGGKARGGKEMPR